MSVWQVEEVKELQLKKNMQIYKSHQTQKILTDLTMNVEQISWLLLCTV